MPELVWIIDPATGDLVVEGLEAKEAVVVVGDLMPPPHELNCARPLATVPLPGPDALSQPVLCVAGLWHASVVEGPGRRSVLQVQGCPLRCSPLCAVPQTHSFDAGAVLPVHVVMDALLDPIGAPRDEVTVLGGEPMAQPVGLAALLARPKERGMHTVVYIGYTLEALAMRSEPAVHRAFELTDLLIDGPYVAALADDAGERKGSRNQRLIPYPALTLVTGHGRPSPVLEHRQPSDTPEDHSRSPLERAVARRRDAAAR